MAESVKTFQAHLTAVMDSLVRASVCEITKLFQDTVNDYLVEISLNRKENEALKLRLRLTENKLRNERKYGMGWAAGRRAAGLLGAEDTAVRKARKADLQRGKPGGAWEERAGGGFRARLNTGGGEDVEEEIKEVASIKEEVEGYRSDSLRLLQEALQMNPSESTAPSSSPTHGEMGPASAAPESSVAERWDNKAAHSEQPLSGGDELSGLETALKAEREREEAESGLGSPSQEPCGSEGVGFIGLDGLCSSQQAMSSSSHSRDPAELQLPSAPATKEEGEESGAESADMMHFCVRCGSGFTSSSDLIKHSCPAAEERPYQCSVCGRAFGHAWSLKSHECVQTGDQPHHCELCGKRFTHSRSLERHQLVHTGERPHRCPQCGRSFSRLGNLERHQRIHTGERPYECEACGKRFSRVEYLKRHQHIHIGDAMLKHTLQNTQHCAQCNQTFSDSEQLKQHQCVFNV